MNTILLVAFLSLFTFICASEAKNEKLKFEKTDESIDKIECSNLYPFQDYYINIDDNNAILIDGIPSVDFKNCSKYAHRFSNPISDSVFLNGRNFVVENNKEKRNYYLNIFEDSKLIKKIKLPVEDPLPEVHDYYIHIFPYQDNVIVYLEDMYTTHYLVCKYNSDGQELLRKEIEHSFITHPEPKTNYYHRYLYFKELTASQMIFTSHISFAEKSKTVVLSMDDFSVTEYDKTANGIILDDNDQKLAGFVSFVNNKFEVQMLNGKTYEFEIQYGNPACEFILKENLLYIANYHPISTGSSLQCFDLNTGKMKWTADVKQVNASHSEYYNTVILSMYKDKIIMEGIESYGNYLQIFDAETGKRQAVFGSFFEN